MSLLTYSTVFRRTVCQEQLAYDVVAAQRCVVGIGVEDQHPKQPRGFAAAGDGGDLKVYVREGAAVPGGDACVEEVAVLGNR